MSPKPWENAEGYADPTAYNAIKKVADERGYQAIFDRASSSDIIFASPRIDVSNEVLVKLGYSK